ncbi:pentapeptide repeat-containing protein [bacterium]|nr:pentapeptide repeat-containing protein [bacterium]
MNDIEEFYKKIKESENEREAFKVFLDIFRLVIQVVGVIAVILTVYFGYQSIKQTQESLKISYDRNVDDRYTKALELISNDRQEVRLSGINILSSVLNETEKYDSNIFESLILYVRQQRIWNGKETYISTFEVKQNFELFQKMPFIKYDKGTTHVYYEPWNDTQMALNILSVLLKRDNYVSEINLDNVNLSYHSFNSLYAKKLFISGSILQHCSFRNTLVGDLKFFDCELHNSIFNDSKITKFNFGGSRAVGVEFKRCDLEDSDFSSAELFLAQFSNSNLKRSILFNAELKNANFEFADLRYSNWESARNSTLIKSISGANLYGIKNPPDGFVNWATNQGAVLLEKDREWQAFKIKYKKSNN